MPRTIHSLLVLLLASTAVFISPLDAIAGKLDRVSDAARSPGSSSSSSNSGSSLSSSSSSTYDSSSSCSSCGDSDGQGLMLFVLALTTPWWVPAAAIEPSGPNHTVGFPRYPYELPNVGGMVVDEEPTASDMPQQPQQPRQSPRKWALQLGAESGYVFDRVWREGLNLRFQTAYRIEFDANWSVFMERQPGAFTNLALGREHVIWRHAQSSAVQFHTSLGAQHLVDSQGDLSGIDFAYGFELYPVKPMTFAVEGALGNLGSAFAPRVRATLGFIHDRFEFLLGYEQQWIGRETLGGPFAGVRLWL